ncbi:MAG: hypothetical protein KBE16_00340, partial [Alphaproteobacteria bacterium]|nr:hypothetical protein [Alphaproteobacteria bacterium]
MRVKKSKLCHLLSPFQDSPGQLAGNMSQKHPELVQSIVAASNDAAIRVRYNSTLVLGSMEGP